MIACQYAIHDTIALLENVANKGNHSSKIHAVIDYYLSPYHRDHADIGCFIPALSNEISHSSEEVQQIFAQELERMIAFISDLATIDRAKGSALFSTMVGSLVLARSVYDLEWSGNLLFAGKKFAKELIVS